MYLIGAAHPNKATAQALLENLISSGERLVTDAEVLQEILHRYTAIGRRDAIEPAFRVILGLVDEVFSVDKEDVLRAGEILKQGLPCSARDAVHIASHGAACHPNHSEF